MSAQLEIGVTPAPLVCGWCAEPGTTTHQATVCCASCAKVTPKERVTRWLRLHGKKNKR